MQLRFEGDGSRATDLPAWNDFAAEVEQYAGGAVRLESVAQALERLDLALGRMEMEFLEELPYRESTAVLHEVTMQVDAALVSLRGLLPALLARVESGDAQEPLERGREAVQQFCEAFARLRREDEAGERWSESAWVHDLCRVGRGWLRGRLPQESFRRRVAGFEEYHRRLKEGLASFEPLPREQAVLEAQRGRLQAALERQEQALAVLQACAESGEEAPVLPALEALCEAAGDMIEVHRLLMQAEEREEERPCLRCGASNPLGGRFCSGCGGVLPRLVPDEPQASRLDLREGGGGRPQYEHLQRLLDSVERLRAGTLAPEEFLAVLDDLEDRLVQADRQLARIAAPAAETPGEQLEIYLAARHAAQESQLRMAEALGCMREYVEQGQPHALATGIELAAAAGEQAAEFERLFQRVLEMGNG